MNVELEDKMQHRLRGIQNTRLAIESALEDFKSTKPVELAYKGITFSASDLIDKRAMLEIVITNLRSELQEHLAAYEAEMVELSQDLKTTLFDTHLSALVRLRNLAAKGNTNTSEQ